MKGVFASGPVSDQVSIASYGRLMDVHGELQLSDSILLTRIRALSSLVLPRVIKYEYLAATLVTTFMWTVLLCSDFLH
jgi:hypothetical protein